MKVIEIGFKDGPSLEEGFLMMGYANSSFNRLEFESVEEFLDPDADLKLLLKGADLLALFPACSVFPMMSVRYHWTKLEDKLLPKSLSASQSLQMLFKMKGLVELSKHWFIENPAGTMHKQWTWGQFHRITHCQYGAGRMKPTNIWTSWDWNARPSCKYGDPCQPSTPRGSRKTGTHMMKTKAERAKLPLLLSKDLLMSSNEHS
jgi:hypothetical protein